MGTITGPPADPPRQHPDRSAPDRAAGDPAAAAAPVRWRRIVLSTLVVVALVAVGVVVLHQRSQGPALVRLTLVGGGSELEVEVVEDTPLSELLAAFELEPTDGRLLSVGGTVLDPRRDPARVLLDGAAIDPTIPIPRTARAVEVIDGRDQVEATRTVEEEIPVPAGAEILRHVEERGAPGRVRRVVGMTSGEVASSETLVAARAPARTTRRVVALTFDDGPNASWTPYILAILRSRGVKATFCMVGTAVEKHPDLARQVVAEGHQICNHTQGHDEGLATADQDRVDAEVRGGRATLVEAGLPEPAFYRPPGGYLSDLVTETARSQGEQVLMWKVDTKDWQRTATTDTVMTTMREQVEPGAVILLHDGGGAHRLTSVAVLPGFIDDLRAQGYEFTFPVIDPT